MNGSVQRTSDSIVGGMGRLDRSERPRRHHRPLETKTHPFSEVDSVQFLSSGRARGGSFINPKQVQVRSPLWERGHNLSARIATILSALLPSQSGGMPLETRLDIV